MFETGPASGPNSEGRMVGRSAARGGGSRLETIWHIFSGPKPCTSNTPPASSSIVTLGVESGDMIGIVGRNGDGKSSLLGMLAGTIEPDAGRVTYRGGLRLGMLGQRDDLDDEATVGFSVVGDAADHELAGGPEGPGHHLRPHLRPRLEFDDRQPLRRQRRRVALAALLIGDWDLLILDEPNNSMGCSFRTPRFYRRGRAASRPSARRRACGRRSGVPCRTALAGKGGR